MADTRETDPKHLIDEHLDAVEAVLAKSGMGRPERRRIIDELEVQIHEMLAPYGENPCIADVRAVVAQLDPPEAYGAATEQTVVVRETVIEPNRLRPLYLALYYIFFMLAVFPLLGIVFPLIHVLLASQPGFMVNVPMLVILAILSAILFAIARVFKKAAEPSAAPVHTGNSAPPVEPKFSKLAIAGALWIPICMVIFLLIGNTLAGSKKIAYTVFFLVVCMAPFITTILGWVAVSQIRHSRGRLYGAGLALFDGLFFPILAVNGFIFLCCCWLVKSIYLATNYPKPDSQALCVIILTAIALFFVNKWIISKIIYYKKKSSLSAEQEVRP